MQMRHVVLQTVVAGAFVTLAAVVPAAAEGDSKQEETDFSGTWVLEEERSETPRSGRSGMSGGFGGRGAGHGGGFGGSGGRGGSAGGRGGRGGGAGMGSGGSGGRGGSSEGRSMRPPNRMTIEQSEVALRISGEDERARTVVLDGRELTDETQSRGRWKKGKLIVVRQGRRGEIRQTMQLIDEGETLRITASMGGTGGRSREVKSVYFRERDLGSDSESEPGA